MNATPQSSASVSSTRHTQIVAHRGGAACWPENTMRAFKGALALGVDAIELDVHLSADGVPIVIHDPTLERTGQGEGPVAEHSASFLASGPEALAPDLRPPRLDEVLALLAPTPIGISVELKSDVNGHRYGGLADKVVDALTQAEMSSRAFVHSFDWTYLEQLSDLASDLPLGANVEAETLEAFEDWEALLDALVTLKVRDVNADHRLVDEQVIACARGRGLGVTLWTVNDDASIARFLALAVDHLCTDRPARALQLREAGMKP